MIDFEEIIVLRDEKNKQKARYAKHRKDAQKKARHRISIYQKCSNFSDDSLQKYKTTQKTCLSIATLQQCRSGEKAA